MAEIVSLEVLMRGTQDRQATMLALISLESRIPGDHPLRRIKAMADQELLGLSRVFDRMYSKVGRPSVAPEKILKSLLLIALYPRYAASGNFASNWTTIFFSAGFWTWS